MSSSLIQPYAEDLIGFLGKVFATVCPGQRFAMNWHLDVLGEHLQAVERGEITRLMVNMPPRSLKSMTVSVAWPAWLLGHEPRRRVLAASYAQTLANKHSMDCRLVMQSDWYQALFPRTRLSREQNEKHKFLTTERGMRMATSIWGTATGEGGDVLIADDPMNPLQAQSRVTRAFVQDWFDHTFSTRLDDKRRGAIVLVMQRLHADDLCGHALAKGGWEVLKLPAMAEETQEWHIGERHFSRAAGSLLHASREDAALIERARRELGSAHFAAQYQQNPLPQEGGMVKLEWFGRF